MIAIPVLASREPGATVAFWKTLGAEDSFVTDDGRYGGITWHGLQFHFYRTDESMLLENSVCRVHMDSVERLYATLQQFDVIHPNGHLEAKPYGFREFSILDPFGVLYTFAEPVANNVAG